MSLAVPRILLVAGLLGGAAAAAIGVMDKPGRKALPPNAVAMVNGQPILRDAWLRAVAAVGSERSVPLTPADQRHILDRLIDEELLVQHGIALGLAERDGRIRGELVSQVMLAARSMNAAEPTPAELEAFYQAHQDFFSPPPRLRVAAWRLDADGVATPFQPPVPDTLLPADKLQHYLGPGLTGRALGLQPGDRIETRDANQQRVALQVLDRRAVQAPPFSEIREQVRSELVRRNGEAAVRALLAELRERQQVHVAADLE